MSEREESRRAEQRDDSLLANYYTKAELAAELDITERSLERYAWLRTGPARTKIGGRVYYHRNAVSTWLQAQTEVQA